MVYKETFSHTRKTSSGDNHFSIGLRGHFSVVMIVFFPVNV